MAMLRKCNECKAQLEVGEKIKAHWRAQHAEKYAQIMEWLGETDVKLEYAKLYAAAGMRGPGATDGGTGAWSEIEARSAGSGRKGAASKRNLGERVDSLSLIPLLCNWSSKSDENSE